MRLLTVHQNNGNPIHYLELSAANGNPAAQLAVACMAENGIGAFLSVDLDRAVRYYERCSDFLQAGAVCFGWCLQAGRGIPPDLTVAAEFLKKAADFNDAKSLNGFGCCLERGDGVDPNIRRAV
jgi:TPR repeat protein